MPLDANFTYIDISYDIYDNTSNTDSGLLVWCGDDKGGIYNGSDYSLVDAYRCGVQQGVDAIRNHHISSAVKSAKVPTLFGLKVMYFLVLVLIVQVVSGENTFTTIHLNDSVSALEILNTSGNITRAYDNTTGTVFELVAIEEDSKVKREGPLACGSTYYEHQLAKLGTWWSPW